MTFGSAVLPRPGRFLSTSIQSTVPGHRLDSRQPTSPTAALLRLSGMRLILARNESLDRIRLTECAQATEGTAASSDSDARAYSALKVSTGSSATARRTGR